MDLLGEMAAGARVARNERGLVGQAHDLAHHRAGALLGRCGEVVVDDARGRKAVGVEEQQPVVAGALGADIARVVGGLLPARPHDGERGGHLERGEHAIGCVVGDDDLVAGAQRDALERGPGGAGVVTATVERKHDTDGRTRLPRIPGRRAGRGDGRTCHGRRPRVVSRRPAWRDCIALRRMGLIARGWISAARLRRKRARYDNTEANRRREDLVRKYAPGRSFVDVGSMWGADGRFSFLAEEVGATQITGLDGMPPTEAYLERHAQSKSKIRFVQGDLHDPVIVEDVGPHDVSYCNAVIYHSPNPFILLQHLHALTREYMILGLHTIPEVPGIEQACVFYPGLSENARSAFAPAKRGHGGHPSPFDHTPNEGLRQLLVGPVAFRAAGDGADGRVRDRRGVPAAAVLRRPRGSTPRRPHLGAASGPRPAPRRGRRVIGAARRRLRVAARAPRSGEPPGASSMIRRRRPSCSPPTSMMPSWAPGPYSAPPASCSWSPSAPGTRRPVPRRRGTG